VAARGERHLAQVASLQLGKPVELASGALSIEKSEETNDVRLRSFFSTSLKKANGS
jgi:hypothetical protein